MKRSALWIAGMAALAGGLVALPCSAKAQADTPGTANVEANFSDLIGDMNAKLAPIAAAAGLSPSDTAALFDPLIRTAIPERADDGKTWGFRMEFDSHQTIQAPGTGLEPHAEGWFVLETAQACGDAFNGGDVVSFRRISLGTLRGFQCVQVSHDAGAGGMISHTLIEGPDRRFEATYQTAVAVGDSPDETRLLTERMVEQNIALATEITAIGVRALERAEYRP